MKYEKQKLIYQQDCENFRAMNTILWQVPLVITTLTGGLWFAVGSINASDEAKEVLLYLAGVADFSFIVVMLRLRWVMQRILIKLSEFDGRPVPTGYIFVTIFSVLLAFSGGVSLYSAHRGAEFYSKRGIPKSKTTREAPDSGNAVKAEVHRI